MVEITDRSVTIIRVKSAFEKYIKYECVYIKLLQKCTKISKIYMESTSK